MPTWPSSLPPPVARGYTEGLGDDRLFFKPEVGAPKVRLRGTGTPDERAGVLTLTEAQWDTLVAFWKTDLAKGSLPFDWTDPRTGALRTAQWGQTAPRAESANDANSRWRVPLDLILLS